MSVEVGCRRVFLYLPPGTKRRVFALTTHPPPPRLAWAPREPHGAPMQLQAYLDSFLCGFLPRDDGVGRGRRARVRRGVASICKANCDEKECDRRAPRGRDGAVRAHEGSVGTWDA